MSIRLDRPSRLPIAALVVVALLAVGAAVLVLASLDRPVPPVRAPDPPRLAALGDTLAGPILTTVDASDEHAWVRFDFSRGSVVPPDDPNWDLAFRRYRVIANGGPAFTGDGGIRDLGEIRFEEVVEAPEGGYVANRADADTLNPAIDEWYDYGFTTHLLKARPRVYAIRTADGQYAKIEIVSYYCPGARPGCLTFRWVWQGDGSRRLTAGRRRRPRGDARRRRSR